MLYYVILCYTKLYHVTICMVFRTTHKHNMCANKHTYTHHTTHRTCTCTRTCTPTHTNTHTIHMHMYKHTCTHACTHAHMHTHTQFKSCSFKQHLNNRAKVSQNNVLLPLLLLVGILQMVEHCGHQTHLVHHLDIPAFIPNKPHTSA